MSLPSISRHLKVLERAGLVSMLDQECCVRRRSCPSHDRGHLSSPRENAKSLSRRQ
ncbi:MAG: ArsR family transcriptional regulator [Microbacterium sp.]|uniref:ArsR family transcriptional regulator n=1 Tax=Microbacterium sp. TaxID=51671 RepID=UPI003F973D28